MEIYKLNRKTINNSVIIQNNWNKLNSTVAEYNIMIILAFGL